mgnify:CR=1 FL=1|jgi:hypothetical protein|tara:strand:- start:1217 stop:2101 length:885 start_codon:yes stop_codon:yes gene_type:complete
MEFGAFVIPDLVLLSFVACFATAMQITGNLRKMSTELVSNIPQYTLKMKDVLDPLESIDMNALIGKPIRIEYEGYINSVISGQKINKAFGEGLTYQEFMESPLASPSIMRPELSEIHNGIAIRDYEWEMKYHLQPHVVYIALTSNYKVGVTRDTNMPYRWIDQGATQAIVLAEVPYRQLAGLIEVSLKEHISDKTAWQRMLKGIVEVEKTITEVRDEMATLVPTEYQHYLVSTPDITEINFPVEQHPEKVKSLKLEKVKVIESKLVGIKGQYLILEDGVMNVRSHAGCRVTLEV